MISIEFKEFIRMPNGKYMNASGYVFKNSLDRLHDKLLEEAKELVGQKIDELKNKKQTYAESLIEINKYSFDCPRLEEGAYIWFHNKKGKFEGDGYFLEWINDDTILAFDRREKKNIELKTTEFMVVSE